MIKGVAVSTTESGVNIRIDFDQPNNKGSVVNDEVLKKQLAERELVEHERRRQHAENDAKVNIDAISRYAK